MTRLQNIACLRTSTVGQVALKTISAKTMLDLFARALNVIVRRLNSTTRRRFLVNGRRGDMTFA